jgi:hypothetical protein
MLARLNRTIFMIAFVLVWCWPPVASAKSSAAVRKSCVSEMTRKAEAGDGRAAKLLAIYFGDESGPQVNASAALRYLKLAIRSGVDVGDISRASARDVISQCEAARHGSTPVHAEGNQKGSPEHERHPSGAIVRPVENLAAGPQEVGATTSAPSEPAAQAPVVSTLVDKPKTAKHRSKPMAVRSKPAMTPAHKPEGAALASAAPEISAEASSPSFAPASVIDLERSAANAEWRGKMHEAVRFWERARGAGSRPAAKRLVQIYSYGAGDVDADYLKAIEASKIAEAYGLTVPELPRK